jgi:hypothetical protein
MQLTNKLMLQGFPQPRLQTALRKYCCRYNSQVCQYNLPARQMLSDVFHINLPDRPRHNDLAADCSVYLIWKKGLRTV